MKPLSDRIIVEILDETEMIGSIIKPTKENERQKTKGRILAIGKMKYLTDEVKVGDIVLYKKYAGTRVELEGKKCVMLREAELDAILYE